MEATPKIYAAICNAMADIAPVAKGQTNQQQHFKYRGIDDAMNALAPVLQKHRLFMVPDVLEQRREERTTKNGGNLIYTILKVRYTVFADDGSNVSVVVVGEGMDSADKSSNKAIAAAMKYAIFQLFCIPTEEMANNDPDRETPPDSQPKTPYCRDCGAEIRGVQLSTGETLTADDIRQRALQTYHRCLCWNCAQKARAAS